MIQARSVMSRLSHWPDLVAAAAKFAVPALQFCLLFWHPFSVSAQGCDQYFVWQPDRESLSSDVYESSAGFLINVSRDFSGPKERELLAAVEATYPILPGGLLTPRVEKPGADGVARWWLDSIDGVKVPLAVTRSAVDYYMALLREYRENGDTERGGVKQLSASLEYSARIESAESALSSEKAVDSIGLFLVEIDLQWQSDCGTKCGLRFHKKRLAVVNSDGIVVELIESPLVEVMME